MSTSVDLSFVKQFESDVHEAFQRRGSFLLNTVRRKNNVKGSSTTFQKAGTGVATTKARNAAITPMNVSHTPVECVLEDFYGGDWVDKLDEAKVNHDERMVLANAGAWALGRKADDQVITQAITTTTFVGDYSTQVTRSLLLGAAEALDDNDVPNDGNRWGLLTPRSWATAMTIQEFADGDFVLDKPFMKGANPRTWLGINWMMHTGLNGKGTTTADNLVYHQTALGYGSGADITSDITWHGDRAAHFVNNMMAGGACLIDANGAVEMRVNDTIAIP